MIIIIETYDLNHICGVNYVLLYAQLVEIFDHHNQGLGEGK
ncbi:MAG: hypothetical protein ACFFCI_13145 [Promethearchaeota archaeon]